jgi:hypothetical protein
VGRGPRLDWTDPRHARPLQAPLQGLADAAWATIQDRARTPGPDQWTAHCGGHPLAPRTVWGEGSAEAAPCLRHPSPTLPWERLWKAADLARAFAGPVDGLETGLEDGVWVLKVRQGERVRSLRYDEAHRKVARVLGWDALPSPADHVLAADGGFRLQGTGLGHRVGLCLGD